jgi:Fe-S cluster biogenesis protein NfuA
MYIQTEETPNPNAVKFIPGIVVNSDNPVFFSSIEEVQNSFLSYKLFLNKGVEGVFLGSDFITITRNEKISWEDLARDIIITLTDHFASGLKVFDNENSANQEKEEIDISTLSEIEKQIVEIIEKNVRPSVAMDGGDIVYKGFEDGIVKLELRGSCSGCPSSTVTLKNGIESMLKHYVPEVVSVEAIN